MIAIGLGLVFSPFSCFTLFFMFETRGSTRNISATLSEDDFFRLAGVYSWAEEV